MMRVPLALICTAFAASALHAERLTEADREALLDNLEKLQAAADSKVDAKFRVALAAFRNAMGNDDAAMELYLNCQEKVNFQEEQRKSQDFRDWKRKEAEKLTDPGMKTALRVQLRWLVMTILAADEKADKEKLGTEAEQVIEGIFQEPERFKNQGEVLGQSVLMSVFARAYEINHLKVDKWPTSPMQIDAVFNDVILPPLRRPSRLADLRAGWVKRIQVETARAQYWGGGGRGGQGGPGGGGGGRDGGRDDKRGNGSGGGTAITTEDSPEMTRFREITLPKLQWDMEADLFRNGDESGAASRMLQLLEKNINHPSVHDWSEQFKELINASGPQKSPNAEPTDAGVTPKTE